MQTSDKATPSHEVKSACQPHGWRTFFDLTSDKATPSHEVKSACQPHGWRTFFDLTSAKLIIFFKKNIYLVIFLHTFASHFRHNIKIRYPSSTLG